MGEEIGWDGREGPAMVQSTASPPPGRLAGTPSDRGVCAAMLVRG